MPCYPALALLTGCAMAGGGDWIRRGTRVLSVIFLGAALAAATLWFLARDLPAPGDISSALSFNPGAYTLSLGHMEDLTLKSFAYLRVPLLAAALAFLIGGIGTLRATGQKAFLAAAIGAVVFFQAARMALVVFDPYLSSRPLADTLLHSPEGKLIIDHHYYTFSSVFFYTNRDALLLNGRTNNLIYGSYAPGAPDVFINDDDWRKLWLSPQRYYVVASESARPRFENLVGRYRLNIVAESGGKMLLTNLPLNSGSLKE
ncbi:MAG: hypothetical protein JO307_14040 [Bryobacterales bacterium]|nr:hypothetical protein [Bryobacterales bacterium]